MSPLPTPRGEWTTGRDREGTEAAPPSEDRTHLFHVLHKRPRFVKRFARLFRPCINLPPHEVDSQIQDEPRHRVGEP
jgi:hypothetical protein